MVSNVARLGRLYRCGEALGLEMGSSFRHPGVTDLAPRALTAENSPQLDAEGDRARVTGSEINGQELCLAAVT